MLSLHLKAKVAKLAAERWATKCFSHFSSLWRRTAWLTPNHLLQACFLCRWPRVFFQHWASPGLLGSGWCPTPQCSPPYHSLLPLPGWLPGGPGKAAGLPDVPFQMDALLRSPLRPLPVVRLKKEEILGRMVTHIPDISVWLFLPWPNVTVAFL